MLLLGISVGIVLVYFVKRYFAGARCTIQKDLFNHTAVVTGGNSGIGKETVRLLSERGCKVIIGARDEVKSQKFIKQLKNSKGQVVFFSLNLADRSSIQSFSSLVKKQLKGKPLNYLINNAGMMGLVEKTLTKEGFQMQIGVNHFGHFYLTYLLWDCLKLSENPRIINVSSRAHRHRGPDYDIDFSNINYQHEGYAPFTAYSRSKKANILFTKELNRKMIQSKINGITVCLHPGLVRTQIARDFSNTIWKQAILKLVTPLAYIFMKSSEEGAQTSLYCVLEQQGKIRSGEYYVDCKLSPILAKQCSSEIAAHKLWEISEGLLGIKFNL